MRKIKSDFDFNQLNAFCHVVKTGSFTKAARFIGLTQPTVTQHIMSLEKSLGVKLLDRKGKHVSLTEPGQNFSDYAFRLLSLREESEDAVRGGAKKVKGRLVLGGSTIPGTYILPKIIGEFIRLYPEVDIVLKVGDTRQIIELAGNGDVDIGIVGSDPGDRSLISYKFCTDKMVLVVPRGHRWLKDKRAITLKKLLGEPFILREDGSATLEVMEKALKKAGIRHGLNIVCRLGSTEAVKEGVKHGLGVSILSVRAVESEVRYGEVGIVPLHGIRFEREFYVVHPKSRTLSIAARTFLNFMKSAKAGLE